MYKSFLIILTIIVMSGCSSVHIRGGDTPHGNKVFPATQTDFRILGERNNIVLGNEFKYIFILDIPFSLLTDILLLPYDVMIMIMIMLSDSDNTENNNKNNN